MIEITLNQGRTIAVKRALYQRIADRLEGLGVRREDVFISLVEVPAPERGVRFRRLRSSSRHG